ncbi:MAG TPA: CHAD domain-containing protein [Vicinamibacterales bacterium]|nr:CHAD domain-containing protein [Vicinamibacterales bacterium]
MNPRKPHVTTVLLARRARALKRHVAGAIKGDGVGVHQARVASRRLREAVPVLATGLKGSRTANARRKIRRLTRALGKVRELDVTLRLLDDMAQRETFPRVALEEVRGRVVAGREEGREQMLKRLARIRLDKLDRRLASVARTLEAERSDGWRQELARRLLKRSKALGAAVEAAGHMYAPEQVHAVRIALKKLRYAMELAAEGGQREAAKLLPKLKRGQETLGRLHDLQVLQTHVAAVQAQPARTTSPDAGLEVIAGALERECRYLHGRYVRQIPTLQSVASTTRTVVVPQVSRAARGRRPIKMALDARGGGRFRSRQLTATAAR